jgi:hypothetical protein
MRASALRTALHDVRRTGYFTSRPALKRQVRVASNYLNAARQLEVISGVSKSEVNTPTTRPSPPVGDSWTDSLEGTIGVATHHDGVSPPPPPLAAAAAAAAAATGEAAGTTATGTAGALWRASCMRRSDACGGIAQRPVGRERRHETAVPKAAEALRCACGGTVWALG